MDTKSRCEEEPRVIDYMAKGGCFQPFAKAMINCHPRYNNLKCVVADDVEPWSVIDVEACVKATAALRRCFAGNPEWFGREYIHRMDMRFDEDLKPSPEQVKMEAGQRFRWWTGMRRS